MGIPGFFGWLLKRCNKEYILFNYLGKPIHEFYIDLNCMIHPSCNKVLNTKVRDVNELEQIMINQCLSDLNTLIQIVKPLDKLYIAVDGVAPTAKIFQQRKRRYKSYEENNIKQKIYSKYNQEHNINNWTNASITPGTEFMEKLHNAILNYVSTLKYPKTIIYSSYHTSGEGEHKIFDHIRENSNKSGLGYERINRIVYGLDADLFFLSMASQKQNIYLMRESNEISKSSNNKSEYTFVGIDNVITCFNNIIHERIIQLMHDAGIMKKIDETYVNDIVFICYMLGNDFVPHIPTIDIKKDGLDMLIDIYALVYMHYLKPIIQISKNGININMLFLEEYILQLSKFENDWILTFYNKNNYKNGYMDNTIEKDLWNLENMETIKYRDVFQPHIGNIDDWKFRYYKNVLKCSENHEQLVNDMCKEYLDGLLWIAEYYFSDCPSWNWSFKYENAPFLSDIKKFIRTYQYNPNTIKFDKGHPLKPIAQLMCVIPKQYYYLLPKKYRSLMISDESNLGDLFPDTFELDVYNKDMYWQCIPILPYLDINRIEEELNRIEEDKNDRKINGTHEDYVFNK